MPSTQSHSTEGRAGASSQASSSRDVMKRYEGDDVTVAVIQGLASLTSRTGTLVVIVGGLVRGLSRIQGPQLQLSVDYFFYLVFLL